MTRVIPVLAEGDSFVVFNKPSGLLVTPSENKNEIILTDCVNDQFADLKVGLHPCHRLDKETSGAILYAKGKKNQKRYMDLFQRRKVHKRYIAFVHGQIKDLNGYIRFYIKDHYQRKFAGRTSPKEALTRYKIMQRYEHFSVVEVEPITGRTHQIRIHFAQLAHPIVGESKYAYRRDFDLKFKRTALHSAEIEWPDLKTEEVICIKCPLAKDMENFIKKNGNDV